MTVSVQSMLSRSARHAPTGRRSSALHLPRVEGDPTSTAAPPARPLHEAPVCALDARASTCVHFSWSAVLRARHSITAKLPPSTRAQRAPARLREARPRARVRRAELQRPTLEDESTAAASESAHGGYDRTPAGSRSCRRPRRRQAPRCPNTPSPMTTCAPRFAPREGVRGASAPGRLRGCRRARREQCRAWVDRVSTRRLLVTPSRPAEGLHFRCRHGNAQTCGHTATNIVRICRPRHGES
jgi:hypothetical protein